MNWKHVLVATLALGLVACSSPTDGDVIYELGTLDESGSVLTRNPEVTVLPDQQVRVRVATVASECARRFDTRVTTDADGATFVAPYDEVAPCSSRVGQIVTHDVTLDFDGPGPQTIVVRTASRDQLNEDRTVVFWGRR